MGYAQYTLADGREAGYAVSDVCNLDGCTIDIDRGLDYLCGQTPGGDEYGCGKYFCGSHLSSGPVAGAQQCAECEASWKQEHPHSYPDVDALVEKPGGPLHYTVRCRCGSWSVSGPAIQYAEMEEQHAQHEADAEAQS